MPVQWSTFRHRRRMPPSCPVFSASSARSSFAPSPSRLPGQEAFRFRHALIRDAAYERLPKDARSDLHRQFVAWLERVTRDRTDEFAEFLGYHLEQAYRYRAEIGAVDSDALDVAAQARRRLAQAGRLAFRRGDARAAVSLLARAHSLPSGDEQTSSKLAPDLGLALFQAGEFERAEEVFSDAIEAAVAIGDRATELHARLLRDQLWLHHHPERVDFAAARRAAEESLAVFRETADEEALTRAWHVLWEVCSLTGEAGAQRDAAEQALRHARRADSRLDEAWSLTQLGYALIDGPTPVSEGVSVCETLWHELGGDPLGEAMVGAFHASLLSDARPLRRGAEACSNAATR